MAQTIAKAEAVEKRREREGKTAMKFDPASQSGFKGLDDLSAVGKDELSFAMIANMFAARSLRPRLMILCWQKPRQER
jgi:hypothetical protein